MWNDRTGTTLPFGLCFFFPMNFVQQAGVSKLNLSVRSHNEISRPRPAALVLHLRRTLGQGFQCLFLLLVSLGGCWFSGLLATLQSTCTHMCARGGALGFGKYGSMLLSRLLECSFHCSGLF